MIKYHILRQLDIGALMTYFLPNGLKYFTNMNRSGDSSHILKRPVIMRSDEDLIQSTQRLIHSLEIRLLCKERKRSPLNNFCLIKSPTLI